MKEAGTPATIKKDDARLAPIKKKRRNIFKNFARMTPSMAPSTVQAKVDKLSQGEAESIVAPTTREGKTPCILGMSTSQIEISIHYPYRDGISISDCDKPNRQEREGIRCRWKKRRRR